MAPAHARVGARPLCHFRHWFLDAQTEDLAGAQIRIDQLERHDHELYRTNQVNPFDYARLLFITGVLRVYVQSPTASVRGLTNVLWHPMLTSLSEAQVESYDNERSRFRGSDAAAPLMRLGLPALPWVLTQGVQCFAGQLGVEALARFVVFGHEAALRRLLEESWGESEWLDNLYDLLPYLLLPEIIPLRDEHGKYAPTFDDSMVDRFNRAAKNNEEMLVNVRQMIVRNNRGDDQFEEQFDDILAELKEVTSERGRLAARMLLIYYHRNKLHIPTYLLRRLDEGLTGRM